jgi:hypothetical protein
MSPTDIEVLRLLEDRKRRQRNEITCSVKQADEVLDRMVIAGLLKFNPHTGGYSITKVGAEELEYYRMEREGMMADAGEMMIEA